MARNKYPEETRALILDKSLELFTEKGYDHTSIQDILNNLGGLSKGAIYHHFKSKEEIFEGVCDKLGEQTAIHYSAIVNDSTRSGKEKFKFLLQSAYQRQADKELLCMAEKFISDDKFFKQSILDMYLSVAHEYIEPIILECIAEGSITANYPKEISEVFLTLINLWINPFIKPMTNQELKNKLDFFELFFKSIGFDMIDDEIVEGFLSFNEIYNQFRTTNQATTK